MTCSRCTGGYVDEAVTEANDQPNGYVCPPCQRRRHIRCTDPECTCCLGNDD